MAKRGLYGIQHLKLVNATKFGQYPDFNDVAKVFSVTAIVKDSASFSDTAPSVTNIEIEDSDLPFASIETDKGSHGFTLQTYDMGQEAYEYLLGFEPNEKTGWIEEGKSFVLPNQAVELLTQKYGNQPAVRFQWSNMKCVVSKSGTLGKSGFPNFQLDFTQVVSRDSNGNELKGSRFIEETEGKVYYSEYRKKGTAGDADANFVFQKNTDGKFYIKSGETFTIMSTGTTNLDGGVLTVANGGTGSIAWE